MYEEPEENIMPLPSVPLSAAVNDTPANVNTTYKGNP
jgi:hypothetical protein